jgi:hypothetical protein
VRRILSLPALVREYRHPYYRRNITAVTPVVIPALLVGFDPFILDVFLKAFFRRLFFFSIFG